MQAARETRQIYQDHYFLTDPDKFIFEFFPLAAEHQFLEHPITRDEFEQLPLLRSTFFHFGLGLARSEGLVQVSTSANTRFTLTPFTLRRQSTATTRVRQTST